MKKIFFTIILLLAFLAFITQIDDTLSIKATNLVNKIEVSGNSEAYLYLTGIYAIDDKKPQDIGKYLLNEYQKKEADDSYEVAEYPESKKITLPEGNLFCKTWEENCLKTLFSANYDLEKLLEENSTLIFRSNQFHHFNEYKTLTKPSINEQFPLYQYITKAERIKVLNAISAHNKGRSEEAIEELTNQFLKLRKSLRLQDTLIGKLVFLMQLSELIDVLSIILSKTDIKVDLIPNLSHSEKDFEMISAREFGMVYYTFMELDKHPDFFQMDDNIPRWMTRIFYKPNMTINAITPIYYRLKRIALLTPDQFAKEIKLGENKAVSSSKLRNYIGDVLIEMSPNFDKYVARFMDFDVKINLFNHVYYYHSDINSTVNPFLNDIVPDVSENKICFQGPFDDKHLLRCLRTKI